MIKSVDIFVIYDDAQYMKGGWINRNRILNQGKDHLFSLSVKNDSYKKAINERVFSSLIRKECESLLSKIKNNYKKAPYFIPVYEMLREILSYEENNLSVFIQNSIQKTCEYLEIKTPMIVSSSLKIDHNLYGEEKVLKINKVLNSSYYINPIGGLSLYNKHRFKKEGIELFFLKAKNISYKQFDNEFVPFLSIIDVMMFNSIAIIMEYLSEFELL